MTRSRSKAGFTLIELMVALVAGVIAITTIYFVGAASSRHFQEQQRIAQTQMSLRMAMEQVHRDIQRAGFLGTPNSTREATCGGLPQRIQAVEFDNDADTAVLPNAGNNGVTADRLRLVGNYASSDAYLATGLDAVGSSIYLQTSWQGYRRDFGVPGVDFSADRFNSVFRVGRMLHIRNMQNRHMFVTITGTNPALGQVSFTPSLGVGGPCIGGLAAGALVAPLARIEYRVTDLTTGAQGAALTPVGGRVGPGDSYRGEAASQLVRREIDFTNGNLVTDPATGNRFERIVLEHVAMVDYGFMVQNAQPNMPSQLQELRDGPAENRLGQAAPEAHDVRSVIVSLSARTAEQDPRFPWVQTAAGNPAVGRPPTRYRVNPGYAGAARVRTLTSEIFLPNVANRGMR